jgi:hypothetical protein
VSRRSLRDRVLEFGDHGALRQPLVTLVDKLQDMPPALQILAPAATFVCMCRGAGLEPAEVLQLTERMERPIDGPFANQWAAMRAYAKGELNE